MPKNISPHILRHSKAMHLLQAGYNMIIIRDCLGMCLLKLRKYMPAWTVNAKRLILEEAFPDER